MKARITASAAEIGPFETLTFYGQPLTRDWSPSLNVSADVERKLRGNRYLEVKGGNDPLDHDGDGQKGGSVPALPKTDAELTPAEKRAAIIAELKAMGVSFGGRLPTVVLADLLAKAKAPAVPVPADEDPQRAELIAQLEGLGVEFDPNADTEALEAALDAATAP